MKTFTHLFFYLYLKEVERSNIGSENVLESVSEIHAILSICKPLATWSSYYGLGECREACGGHGYLKVASLGDIRANIEATITYEGDNNVLSQQTSNWLLRQWKNVLNGSNIDSPFNTIDFLCSAQNILQTKFYLNNTNDVLSHECKYEL